MDKTTSRIHQLRDAIEQRTGVHPATPKDFDALAADIYAQLHESVSASTLKRVWGYVNYESIPRIATLNVLAQFVGYNNWHGFCQSMGGDEDDEEDVKEEEVQETVLAEERKESGEDVVEMGMEKTENRRKKGWNWWGIAALVVGLLLLLGGLIFWKSGDESASLKGDTNLVLKAGQTFGGLEDYLPLFGIVPSEHWWDEPLPHHRGIIVWTPCYLHPNWHNEGCPDSLFPTITEYWTPAEEEGDSVPQSLVRQRNENLFFTVTRTNELRITFMRGIAAGDSATFLGVYRLDRNLSDSTHLVWQRMSDRCDLRSLDYLEELRN